MIISHGIHSALFKMSRCRHHHFCWSHCILRINRPDPPWVLYLIYTPFNLRFDTIERLCFKTKPKQKPQFLSSLEIAKMLSTLSLPRARGCPRSSPLPVGFLPLRLCNFSQHCCSSESREQWLCTYVFSKSGTSDRFPDRSTEQGARCHFWVRLWWLPKFCLLDP